MPNSGEDPCIDRDGLIWYRTTDGRLARDHWRKGDCCGQPSGFTGPRINMLLTDAGERLWWVRIRRSLYGRREILSMNPVNGEQILRCSTRLSARTDPCGTHRWSLEKMEQPWRWLKRSLGRTSFSVAAQGSPIRRQAAVARG